MSRRRRGARLSPRRSPGWRQRRSPRCPTCRAGGSTRCRRRPHRPLRVLRKLKPERVVFSVFGLREGWLYAQLDARGAVPRPAAGGRAVDRPADARVPEFSAALARWTDDLFPGETQSDRRLRLAVCALTDMAWRDHEKVRALRASAGCCSSRSSASPTPSGRSSRWRSWPATAARSTMRCERRPANCWPEPAAARGNPRAGAAARPPVLGERARDPRPGAPAHRRRRGAAGGPQPESIPDSDAVQARLRQLARVSGVEGAEIVAAGARPRAGFKMTRLVIKRARASVRLPPSIKRDARAIGDRVHRLGAMGKISGRCVKRRHSRHVHRRRVREDDGSKRIEPIKDPDPRAGKVRQVARTCANGAPPCPMFPVV